MQLHALFALSLMLNHNLTRLVSQVVCLRTDDKIFLFVRVLWGNRLSCSKDSVLQAVAFECGKIVKKTLHFFRHKPEISWCAGTSLYRQMFLIRCRVITYFSSSMLTLYRLAFRAEIKSYPLQYEQQKNAGNWNKSRTHMDGISYRSGWPRGSGARGYSAKSYTGRQRPKD